MHGFQDIYLFVLEFLLFSIGCERLRTLGLLCAWVLSEGLQNPCNSPWNPLNDHKTHANNNRTYGTTTKPVHGTIDTIEREESREMRGCMYVCMYVCVYVRMCV